MLGCCRLSLTRQPAPAAPPVDHAAHPGTPDFSPRRGRSEQTDAIFAAWRTTVAEAKPINDEIEALWKAFPEAATSILHLAEREPGNRRIRICWNAATGTSRRKVVEPHTPAAFHPFPDGCTARSARLRPLADRSPVAVDGARRRQSRSGRRFSAWGWSKPRRISARGRRCPEYRELLDWLAVDFMEHGWSQKHLIRTIVTSATYQQSSEAYAGIAGDAIRAITGWRAGRVSGPKRRSCATLP